MKCQSQALWIVATFPCWPSSTNASTTAPVINSTSRSYCCHRYRVSSCIISNAGSNYLAGRWPGSMSSTFRILSKNNISTIATLSSSFATSKSAAVVVASSPLLLSLFISADISSNRRTRIYSRQIPIAATVNLARTSIIASARKMSSTSSSNIDASNMHVENKNHCVIHPQVKNRVALLQLPVTHNKDHNLQTAIDYIRKAQCAGAQLCVLPEIWNSPYATSAFPEYAELLPQVGDALPLESASAGTTADSFPWGMSSRMLMEMAKSTNMHIVGGSIPEVVVHHISKNSDNHEQTNTDQCYYYNTCLIINPHGKVVAKHRKVHLFDVNVPGGIQFKESETLTAGDLGATYFDVVAEEENRTGDEDERTSSSSCELGRIGVGIWYVFVPSSI